MPQPNKAFKEWKDEFLSPFFSVRPTAVEEEANMIFQTVEHKGISFQVLVNKRKVNAFGHLFFFEAKAEKKALQNATVVVEEEKEEKGKEDKEEKGKERKEGERSQPSKRRRTTR